MNHPHFHSHVCRLFLVIPLLCVLFAAVTASGRTWYVLPDSTGDAPDIQAAIDSSGDGDTVLVAAGTYYVNLQITGITDFTLISESGPEVTILDGSPSFNPQYRQVVRVFQSPDALVEGFTIQNANPSTIAGWGGGIRIIGGGRVTIRGNIIRANNSKSRGGGLAFSNPCEGCGGSVIEGNQFIENTCSNNAAGIWIYGVDDGCVFIKNNLFQGNVGGYGGIRAEYSNIILTNNIFMANESTSYCLDIVGTGRVEGNLVVLNEGGGDRC
ncbi:MAG: right-handed parallel beta-helix repeat-containing protein [Candidatus Eisenbacteria bacterium]|nr:right-handed parallel beta-helix repeat-containing protein [Candidatus Eisenbacteria bacterium]